MPKTMTADDLVNNSKVQKYIDTIDSDAEAAMDLAQSVIGSATGKLYSSTTLASYKGDVARLDRCWGDFNAAWNKVVFGKAKDNKEIIKTYSKYVLALEVLEESNTRHEAMMTAGFALFAAALIDLLIAWAKEINKMCKEMEAELKALEKLLKKAKREVVEAGAQTALNLALTAVTLCLGPVGWGARIGIAVGSIGTHMVIDAALGPSKGSTLGTINTTSGEAVMLVDKLDGVDRKLLGGASAVLTLKMDTDEIGDAIKIVEEVQAALRHAQDRFRSLRSSAARWNKDIGKLKMQYDRALKAYEAAAGKFRSSQRSREELLKEFKQWK